MSESVPNSDVRKMAKMEKDQESIKKRLQSLHKSGIFFSPKPYELKNT